jgi:chromosomal replication initiation ATPase DnaA
MLAAIAHAKEVRDKLRNPINGRISDEREIVSEHVLRRHRLAVLVAEEEAKREANLNGRWNDIITRLIATADKEAAEIAEQEGARGGISMEVIIRVVCGLFHIKRVQLMSMQRTASTVYPRQVAMYLCRTHTGFSLPQIGVKFAGRDHTTVLHSFNKITTLLTLGDPKVTQDIARLRHVLGVE